jgi:hypothetical protein
MGTYALQAKLALPRVMPAVNARDQEREPLPVVARSTAVLVGAWVRQVVAWAPVVVVVVVVAVVVQLSAVVVAVVACPSAVPQPAAVVVVATVAAPPSAVVMVSAPDHQDGVSRLLFWSPLLPPCEIVGLGGVATSSNPPL